MRTADGSVVGCDTNCYFRDPNIRVESICFFCSYYSLSSNGCVHLLIIVISVMIKCCIALICGLQNRNSFIRPFLVYWGCSIWVNARQPTLACPLVHLFLPLARHTKWQIRGFPVGVGNHFSLLFPTLGVPSMGFSLKRHALSGTCTEIYS